MRLTLYAATVAVLALGALPQAQRPATTFRLVVDTPRLAGSSLQRAARDGFTCAAVARPLPPLLPKNLTVLLTRPSGPAGPAPAMQVVMARAAGLDAFEEALNKTAAAGFRLCGVTVTQPEYDRSNIATLVAVMSQVDGPPPRYDVLHTRLQPGEWEPLERSAAAGFLVAHVLPRPQASGAGADEMLLVAEQTAVTPPSVYALVFAETADALQNALKGRVAGGYRIQALWPSTSNGRINVLMAKPLAGAWPDAPDYRVDEREQLRLSGVDGELGWLTRRKGGVVTIHDKARRSESTITSGVISDATQRPAFEPRIQIRFVELLDSSGGRGYRPFEFTLRPGTDDELTADVVMLRPPAP